MKIEVILCEDINERCNYGTCFEASKFIANQIKEMQPIKGIILIDGVATKFAFSCAGMDGNIFTTNTDTLVFIKNFIPAYVYSFLYQPQDMH